MGSNLGIRTQVLAPVEDHTWLGSAHGTDICDPITLDGALLVIEWPTGIVPSGIVVAKVTATGRYGPYLAGASNGQQTAAGILFTTVNLLTHPAYTPTAAQNVGGALFWHGEVILSKMPATTAGYTGADSAAQTALKNIRFV